MRSITANWFETKVKFEKVTDDGLQKKVTELYVVDALSFSEAEARITEEMSHYINGVFDVDGIKKTNYKEIFFSDDQAADKWYKAKLQFTTVDEKSEREKKSSIYYLVQGFSLDDARLSIDIAMGGTMLDYSVASVVETSIMDVFNHTVGDK